MFGIKRDTFIKLLLIAWVCFLSIATIVRLFFGVEITDEAFYVSEVVSVIRGNVPYTEIMGRTAGFTFIMLPFIKLYSIFVPNLTGVFLFSRMMFTFFCFSILFFSYVLLRPFFNKQYLIFSLSLLIPVSGMFIPNFSYNTISVWLLYFAGVVQFSSIKSDKHEWMLYGASFSGVLVALAEFAHPGQILNVLWFGITLLICAKKSKVQMLVTYIASGMLTVSLILGIIILSGGFGEFVFGIETILKYTNVKKASLSIHGQLWNVFSTFKWIILIFLITFLIICIIKIIQIYFEKFNRINDWNVRKFIRTICFMDIVLITILYCTIKICKIGNGAINAYYLGALGVVFLIVCWLRFVADRDEMYKLVVSLFMTPPLCYFFVTGLFTDSLAYTRMKPFVFCIFGFALLLEPYFFLHTHTIIRKLLCIISLSSIFLTLLYSNYSYIYRDAPIALLNTRVETGIYKNLYTTQENADAVVGLEDYIKDNTSEDDKVLFMDLAPMAYLMSNGIPWTPSTWDRLQYSYGFNRPEIMYRYFENKKDIPDIIIYIDSGRDEILSIDMDGYLFNDFVNANYVLDSIDKINNRFEVKKFIQKT